MQTTKKILHSLDKYLAVGFDVDHCLVRYRLRRLVPLAYTSIAKVLVDKKGYPHEMLEFGKKEMCFVMNGLIVDMKTAYILKLGEDKIILRAYHGYERVSQEDLESKFGKPPKYEIFDPYRCRTDDYTCCLTFFECFVPSLLAHMIEYKKKIHHPEEINAREILKDVLFAVIANYGHFTDEVYHSIAGYGHFFPEIVKKVDDVIYTQEKLKETLINIKENGKILFIVSNSHYEFVELLMDHAFGKDWQKLFHFIVANSKKPDFFGEHDKPFMEIDVKAPNRLGKVKTELELHEAVTGGSAQLLEENIKRISEGKSGRILFFGDNYSTDVLAAEKIAHWDGVCIMEELGDVDFGDGYDESYWGHWKYEETPYGNIPTFWSNYMSKNVAMCTSLVDSIEMNEFYKI